MDQQIRTISDDAVWDEFVRRSPQGTPFMLSALLKASATRLERLALDDNGRLVAVAPIFYDDRGQLCPPPAFMFYQGMLLAPSDEVKAGSRVTRNFRLTETFVELLAEKCHRIDLHQHWAFEDLRPFQWLNYHSPEQGQFSLKLLYTGLLDLGGFAHFDGYLKDIRTLRRREYKRALSTCLYEESDDIERLIDLHDKTYSRQGIALSGDLRHYRRRIIQAGLDNGFGSLRQAVSKDGVASMIYFLRMGDTAYYLFGANDPEHRDSGASSGLMLHMIENAMASGARWVDFCGINSPTRGDYKISLGATPRPFFLLSYKRP